MDASIPDLDSLGLRAKSAVVTGVFGGPFACEKFHKRIGYPSADARSRRRDEQELRRGLVLRHPRLHLRLRHSRLRRAGLVDRRLAAYPAAVRHRRRLFRRVRGVHADLLPGAKRHQGAGSRERERQDVKPYVMLVGLGGVLVVAIALLGGKPAAIGAATAVLAQCAAIALLRPAMTAPQPQFLAR